MLGVVARERVERQLVVIAQRPKLSPYADQMRANLARALSITSEQVSVKGKTNEGMGWIGRAEGLACMAVASLVARDRS